MKDPSDVKKTMLTRHFQFSGVKSYLTVQKPTKSEWEDDMIPKIEFTAEDLVWDQTSSEFPEK